MWPRLTESGQDRWGHAGLSLPSLGHFRQLAGTYDA